MKIRLILCLLSALLGSLTDLYGQTASLKRFYNRTAPKLALNLANATKTPQVSAANVPSNLWRLEPVGNRADYYRIINNETGQNLDFEDGQMRMADVPDDDRGAIWTTNAIAGTQFVNITSLQTGQRLNLTNGKLQLSDISGKAPGAMWQMTTARATTSPATPPVASANNKQQVNDYVRSLTYDPRRLLAVEGDGGTILQDKQTGSSSNRKTDDNAVILCTTTNYSMSNNFDEVVVMQPTNGIVYPGALVYADQSLVRGQPRPLTSLPPAPVRLTVDLPGIGEKGTFVVKNPANGTVQTELQKALTFWNNGPAYKEGYINAARSSSNAEISYNSQQIGMSLGVNVKWASGEAGAQFSYNTTSSRSVALMMFKQVFYTVTAEPFANPADAFGAINLAKAQVAFNNDTPPAYVQSVSYGRIIMFRLETSEKVDEAKLKASLKYAAGAVTVDANTAVEYQSILRNSTLTYALLGGNAEVESQIASARNFNDLEPLIKGKNSVYSKSNPGLPIAYTVRFLKDHQIAKMGMTTDYTKETCERKANMYVQLVHSGAYVAKYEINYTANGANQKVETGDKTAGWSQTFYFPGDATNISLKGWAMTGLVWDPWGEIYNLFLGADRVNKCYRNTGTTLGRNWDNNCGQ